jgi:hypothetical protein
MSKSGCGNQGRFIFYVGIVFLVSLMLLSTGCASFPGKQMADYKAGRILVLPPRDVVQNGRPHVKGEDSGKVLMDYVMTYLSRTGFEGIQTENPQFSHTAIASKEEALLEARQVNADYYLQIALGEFLDAAPMTFRPDNVTLNQAVLIDSKTGDKVWELTRPVYYQKGNPGSYHPLLKVVGSQVVKSITR